MAFMDDLKTNQRTQILVVGVVFFAISFPLYFNFAANNVDDYEVSGPVANYLVKGNYSYHSLGEGTVTVADGESESFTVNTDMISSEIDGKNIVGVRAVLNYTDNEQPQPFCDSVDDDVTGHLMHADLHAIEPVQSGDIITILWHNSSIVGETVNNMSEGDVRAMLDNTEMIGYGEQLLEISVDVNRGDCDPIRPPNNDSNEEVSYTWELISLDYTLEKVDNEESEDDESEDDESEE